jgi:uncharacterized membrane protein YidH (DUF202 family)
MSSFPDRHALQPERTALAWQRTAITALVVLLPVVLVSLRIHRPVLTIAGACGALASAFIVLSVRRRFHQLHDDDRGFSPHPPMAQVAAVTVLGAAGGVALGITLFVR